MMNFKSIYHKLNILKETIGIGSKIEKKHPFADSECDFFFTGQNVKIYASDDVEYTSKVKTYPENMLELNYTIKSRNWDKNWLIMDINSRFNFSLKDLEKLSITLTSQKKMAEVRIILQDKNNNELTASLYKLETYPQSYFFNSELFSKPHWSEGNIDKNSFFVQKIKVLLSFSPFLPLPYTNTIYFNNLKLKLKPSNKSIYIEEKSILDIFENDTQLKDVLRFEQYLSIQLERNHKLSKYPSLHIKNKMERSFFKISRPYPTPQNWNNEIGFIFWAKGKLPPVLGIELQNKKGDKSSLFVKGQEIKDWKIFAFPLDKFQPEIDLTQIISYNLILSGEEIFDFYLDQLYLVNTGKLLLNQENMVSKNVWKKINLEDKFEEEWGYAEDKFEEEFELEEYGDIFDWEEKEKNPLVYPSESLPDLSQKTTSEIQELFNLKEVDIYLEPTNLCNYQCLFCYHRDHSLKRPIGVMKLDEWKEFLFKIRESSFRFRALYPFFSGETFVHPQISDFLEEAGKLKKDKIITHFGIDTNGFLEEEQVKIVSNSPLDSITFSLDSHDIENYGELKYGGDLEFACQAIEQLLKIRKNKKPVIGLGFLYWKKNHDKLLQFVKFVKERFGITKIYSFQEIEGLDVELYYEPVEEKISKKMPLSVKNEFG
jgi:pyruvate-formate lyase-activating enzyme